MIGSIVTFVTGVAASRFSASNESQEERRRPRIVAATEEQ